MLSSLTCLRLPCYKYNIICIFHTAFIQYVYFYDQSIAPGSEVVHKTVGNSVFVSERFKQQDNYSLDKENDNLETIVAFFIT